jgi:hypothetical protein
LADLGFRTTKSVWAFAGSGTPAFGGSTCDDPVYCQWLLRLQQQGFEMGLHNATYHTSPRQDTIRAFDRFAQIFGHDPKTLTNHPSVGESIYWFARRLSGSRALAYNLMTGFRNVGRSRGHMEGDPLFWGDICRQRVKYVRNFVFSDINTLAECPAMPYHDPARPYVNYWFASSPGADLAAFNRTLTESQQDHLEEEGGACIMYAHFARGFYANNELNPRFRQLMERLARKGGFFVPVAELLDHILLKRGHLEISKRQRRQLELRWLLRKVFSGSE